MPRSWSSMEHFETFLGSGGVVEVDDDMPAEYRTAVFGLVERHANGELMRALAEREWTPRAPGLGHKLAALAETQDEIGHAHLLYMVAADMGHKSRGRMIDDLLAGRSPLDEAFTRRVGTWGDRVAVALLVDAAVLAGLQAVFNSCSYGPYKRVLARIIAEEGSHMRLGEDRIRRFAAGTENQRVMFQRSIDDWWWPALLLLGPDREEDEVLFRWYLRSERNDELRRRWVQRFVPLLHGHGFTIPDPDLHYDTGAGCWLTGPIDPESRAPVVSGGTPQWSLLTGDAAGHRQRSSWVRRALATGPT